MRVAIAAISIACVCAVSAPSVFAAGYFLYAPRPTEDEQPAPGRREEGVLVKEITIQRGDTLSAISRTFSGHATYFPQILLFNDIRNPDLIYTGNTLRVPVTKTVVEEKKKEETKQPGRKKKREKDRKAVKKEPDSPVEVPVVKPSVPVREQREEATGEQLLYGRAVKAYRSGNCEEALGLFEAFLKQYPDALSAPDIALLRADCHLKLSEEQ